MARTREAAVTGASKQQDEINELLGIVKPTPAQTMKKNIEDIRSYEAGKPVRTPFPGFKGPGKPIGPENEEFIDPTKEYPGSWGRRTDMMLPTVPQVNPMAMFNRPTQPGAPPMGMGTPANAQLLSLLGGLGGPISNPLAPTLNKSMNPQPGPPTDTATQILGALGAGLR